MPDKIDHVVVLMLENRSFDCMLGSLRPKSADFDGLDGTETNPLTNPPKLSLEFALVYLAERTPSPAASSALALTEQIMAEANRAAQHLLLADAPIQDLP